MQVHICSFISPSGTCRNVVKQEQISTGCLRDYYLSIITSIWHKQADFKATKFSDSFVQLRGKFAMCGFLFCLQIPVPVITPSSRWSFDPEEERKRQEKWQKEQERLLQVCEGVLLYI